MSESVFIKKEALAQVFSFEFCKIFKSTFFKEHVQATTSEYNSKFRLNCVHVKVFDAIDLK